MPALKEAEELQRELEAAVEARQKAEDLLKKANKRVQLLAKKKLETAVGNNVSFLLDYGYEDRRFYVSVLFGTVRNPAIFFLQGYILVWLGRRCGLVVQRANSFT